MTAPWREERESEREKARFGQKKKRNETIAESVVCGVRKMEVQPGQRMFSIRQYQPADHDRVVELFVQVHDYPFESFFFNLSSLDDDDAHAGAKTGHARVCRHHARLQA
jgi:hypothetical protein